MTIKNKAVISAATLIMAAQFTPVLASDASSVDTVLMKQVCLDGVEQSGNLIQQYVDGIEITEEAPVQEQTVYNEPAYSSQQVVYILTSK